jgi:hypothetical protein
MIASEKPQRTYRYRVVDVFTQQPLEGNPLAVFPDATGLDDLTMQRIARELNLSETTFVIPSTRVNCAIGVRIFTAARELGRVDELFDNEPCSYQMNQRQKGLAQFLIPCRNTAKLFEVVEEPFHLLA